MLHLCVFRYMHMKLLLHVTFFVIFQHNNENNGGKNKKWEYGIP
jgi:hypothetical protein